MWKDSYKKSREDRIKLLKENGNISEDTFNILNDSDVLSDEMADKFIENQIGVYGIPLGLATNFLINGKEYIIPFAIEEPSVIAAACNAAKIIKKSGGFKAQITDRLIIGQIAIYDVKDFEKAKNDIYSIKDRLLKIANDSQKSIVNLGGGARDIKLEKKEDFLIIYLYVDAVDAMGANTVNTMLESIAPVIVEICLGTKLMSIISNYSTSSMVKAECFVEIEEDLGKKIEKAIEFANADIYRAVTNNKGIFNGIDAISLATGNDWRAIEAGAHAYASRDGKYKSLTSWKYKNGILHGIMELPLAIASFGGSVGVHPTSKISLEILGNPNAKELSEITACVGLAQNFAALRALVTVGIQKGHMKLQLKSFAMYLGLEDEKIKILEKEFENETHITLDKVKEKIKYID
ncbi:hydroxymethylglutaryl-CoA reductase, degradative [Streptobacillus moniliformis]|uniref:hydroxymethylglutaryl-CoA reductase, degradative n=1 Tax=Streptobacillus moniliformis TaxID=34105 RepID=UPI0007E375AC|nr:hydroxymethylglutaryl-CoA reductase, degradative [Streptobacillus moniliformis]